MDYVDFVVGFQPPEMDSYATAVVTSPAGQTRQPLHLDVTGVFPGLPDLGRRIRRSAADAGGAMRDLSPPTGPSPTRVGADLHRALITGEIQRLFATTRGIAAARNAGLRLCLDFDLGHPVLARLARLPWELLFDEERNRFLLRGDRRLLLVRSLAVPEYAADLAVPPPLRILVVLANPAGLPALDLDDEKQRIARTLAGRTGIEVHFLAQPDLSDLRQRVLESHCQALHFMGHGQFEPRTGEGTIALASKNGQAQLVSGTVLAQHLCDLGLRLIVLNACKTAEVAGGAVPDPFAGVAAALVHGGLTAAVAMQFPISDPAAIRFSEVYYQRLAAGDLLDLAMSEARLALHTNSPDSFEWATPVLYLRVSSSPIVTPTQTSRFLQACSRLRGWIVPPGNRGWTERLLEQRRFSLPIGIWLVTSLCTASQALVWFYLGLLAKQAAGYWHGYYALLTLAALCAPFLTLRCAIALPPRLFCRSAVAAFLLASGVWFALNQLSS